ncbi:hypothetical protein [Carboxylicivirga linearis]|uniref:Uncharacterized protein n=1 Tax=Carboxylicivirga linearis TaxID=1628157 RepID=A0ABS5JSM0_9BACT|nr:hypothetical protein [Carboxylicivirga linearis]MBS2097893.1 hypothetical protein [Carboxylicivirga linearis]
MWPVLLLSIILMGIVFALMAIRVLLQKNGKFPNTHIGGNKALNSQGIYCATTQDKLARKEAFKIKPLSFDGEYDSQTTSC